MAHGIQTLLMTDVVGSTRLWSAHADAMPAALVRMEALALDAARTEGGEVVKRKGEGDSLFCILPSPAAAARAARSLVVALRAEPGLQIKVRAAIHCGTAHVRDGDLYGPMPNRCARLREVGHGDQILLTGAARTQIEPRDGIALRDLGRHRLRDLDEPESVYQLLAHDLPDDFPPLRSLTCLRNNLPLQYTSFIGREALRQDLLDRLRVDRLTTLTGAGGSGKTRLSLQLGAEVIDEFPDGVWFVELADLSTEAAVSRAVGEAAGLADSADIDAIEAVAARLRNHPRILLLLDNAEHALGPIGRVAAALLAGVPDLRILCTSREPLRLRGERVHRVPPLTVPQGDWSDVERIAATEAVGLFVDRARLHLPEFVLRASNAPAVAEIARRLDGIPLCLEMVASHVGYLGPDQIAARLHDRFALLKAEGPGGPPRHRTMRETIAWQYDTLSEGERLLLQRLAAFAGGFSLEAAAAIGADDVFDPETVLPDLKALVEKSLVIAFLDGDEMRYRLLEVIGQFAYERGGPVVEAAMPRITEWCLKAAREGYASIHGPDHAVAVARLDAIDATIRKAMTWAIGARDERAVDLCLALTKYWYLRGRYLEARGFLERTRQVFASSGRRLELTNAIAVFAMSVGDYASAAEVLRSALEDEALNQDLRAKLRANLAMSLSELGLKDEAYAEYETSGREARERGNDALARNCGYNAALILSDLGRYAEAVAAFGVVATEFRLSQDLTREARCHVATATCLVESGDRQEARSALRKAMPMFRVDAEADFLVGLTLTATLLAAADSDRSQAAFLYGATKKFQRETKGALEKRDRVIFARILEMVPELQDEDFHAEIDRGSSASFDEISRRCVSRPGPS